MTDVVIIDAIRTPIGRYKGALSTVRADHLGAHVLNELIARTGIPLELIEDVIFGCVTQVGEQCGNVARTSLLGAGWPSTIPGMTVDRKCGSSEAAIHAAVGAIASGALDIVVAGGVESMSRVPMGANREIHGEAFGWRVTDRFALTSQGEAAERIADRWNFTREDVDDYAMESHRRAASASDAGYFDREIAPISLLDWAERGANSSMEVLRADETIRRDTSRQRLSTLKTSFREQNGRITAGNSSQISDGAAAILLMSKRSAEEHGFKPRAKIRSIATVGSDPELMLLGPISATRKVLQRAGLSIDDIDLFEVNEAFASVPLVWLRELGASHAKLNVNGGAIALGHPLGASGARIMTTLVHEMQRRDACFGLQSICCAGGLGTATVLERL